MCMKNVNAISRLYDYVELGNQSSGDSVYKNQFDVIQTKIDDNGRPYIGGFYVVTDFNLLGTSKEEDKLNNIVNSQKIVKAKIRLTKLSRNIDRQYSWDLDCFDIDPTEKDILHEGACVPYVNYTKISRISKIPLKEDDYLGEYVVKILIKNNGELDDLWTVQSISNLRIV